MYFLMTKLGSDDQKLTKNDFKMYFNDQTIASFLPLSLSIYASVRLFIRLPVRPYICHLDLYLSRQGTNYCLSICLSVC